MTTSGIEPWSPPVYESLNYVNTQWQPLQQVWLWIQKDRKGYQRKFTANISNMFANSCVGSGLGVRSKPEFNTPFSYIVSSYIKFLHGLELHLFQSCK